MDSQQSAGAQQVDSQQSAGAQQVDSQQSAGAQQLDSQQPRFRCLRRRSLGNLNLGIFSLGNLKHRFLHPPQPSPQPSSQHAAGAQQVASQHASFPQPSGAQQVDSQHSLLPQPAGAQHVASQQASGAQQVTASPQPPQPPEPPPLLNRPKRPAFALLATVMTTRAADRVIPLIVFSPEIELKGR